MNKTELVNKIAEKAGTTKKDAEAVLTGFTEVITETLASGEKNKTVQEGNLMNKKKIYAAYGSNMNISQMEKRCPAAAKICVGTLKGYQLEFRGGGVATIIPKHGSEVPIVLWNITRVCEKVLDIYEGYPRLYIKKEISINVNDTKYNAMAYIMTEEYAKRKSSPSSEYLKAIRDSYRDNEIDSELLNKALERSLR